MVKNARIALLAALLGATIPVMAQTAQMSPADNEASAMGNCFDRRLGVSRSAMDVPVGSSRPTSSVDAGSSVPSRTTPPSNDAAVSDATAAPDIPDHSASPSSLPDCK